MTRVLYFQWPCQEPKFEVPTICKAYVRAMQRNIPQKIAFCGTVPPFWVPEISIDIWGDGISDILYLPLL